MMFGGSTVQAADWSAAYEVIGESIQSRVFLTDRVVTVREYRRTILTTDQMSVGRSVNVRVISDGWRPLTVLSRFSLDSGRRCHVFVWLDFTPVTEVAVYPNTSFYSHRYISIYFVTDFGKKTRLCQNVYFSSWAVFLKYLARKSAG